MVFTGSQFQTIIARSMLYPCSESCWARTFRWPKSETLRSCWTAGGCAAQYASISAIGFTGVAGWVDVPAATAGAGAAAATAFGVAAGVLVMLLGSFTVTIN